MLLPRSETFFKAKWRHSHNIQSVQALLGPYLIVMDELEVVKDPRAGTLVNAVG